MSSPHLAFARTAAPLWDVQPEALRHVADRGNSVWFCDDGAFPRVLRLTDPAHRSIDECRAELEYLMHLHAEEVPVAPPIASREGNLLEPIELNGDTRAASVFCYAPGIEVHRDTPHWTQPFFQAWGHALGQLHAASSRFQPRSPARRWHWRDEYWIAKARDFLPSEDTRSISIFEGLMESLGDIEESSENFGMIHADFAPQNFHYDPQKGITAFDFGNCCYHWYASDLAISFSTLTDRDQDEQLRLRSWILDGYRLARPFTEFDEGLVPRLMRLRTVYVYLSRLWYFGAHPTPEQQETLRLLQGRVHRLSGKNPTNQL